jgi:hypothetical protein
MSDRGCPSGQFSRARLCQFASQTAELTFLPYNYLVDPQLRRALGDFDWCACMQPLPAHARALTPRVERRRSAALLFDEAHNLVRAHTSVGGGAWPISRIAGAVQEGVCAESASFDLPAAHLAACIQEVCGAALACMLAHTR